MRRADIKDFMRRRTLTEEKLARMSGLTAAKVRRILSGKEVVPPSLERFVRLYDKVR